MRALKLTGLLFLQAILRFLISLRYRVEVKGLEEVLEKEQKGILFLPNHPAEMDPVILVMLLWPAFRLRPLVVEHFYYQKGLRFFMDLIDVLPLPTVDVTNQWKEKQIEKLKSQISERLAAGENFMIYPSGKLKRTPDEKLGGASMVPDLLARNPKAPVVLVRTTGLWGSSFSRALTGASPDFRATLWQGFKILLKNGIFFAPKRDVLVEVELAGRDLPRSGDKMEVNAWLENWYNKRGPEPLKLVSFSCWKEELPKIQEEALAKETEELPLSDEVRVQILTHLSKLTHRPVTQIQPQLHLSNDLGLDSLDVAQLYIYLEERFGIGGLAPGELQTVHELFQAAAGAEKERARDRGNGEKEKWPKESFRKSLEIPEGEILQEVFLKSCIRMNGAIACSDALSGVLSYRRVKLGALVLSEKIKEMPGDHIGVLLPSSVGAYMTILAVLLAGKIPVMLNWTAGYRNLEHAAKVCKLQVILSSYRFLSRLDHVDLGDVERTVVLLEDLRKGIGLSTKLKGFLLNQLGYRALLRRISNLPKGDDPAVVIFTSGTETLPKGVPLSHQNLLCNLRAALSCIQLNEKDSLYGVLPPFHSFGLSVTGIFPLLAGLKVCYAPDPTDSKSLANDIAHWKPSVFCCAPSFVKGLVRVATDEQLASLRLVVTGAEKIPQELYDTLAAKGKVVLEGYGISECSPVVTLEREGEPHKGVGRPLPNVELCVIHPETKELLAQGKEGEVCIAGPSVFQGYIGVDKNPFISIDGKVWYRSGDRGVIDAQGTLVITGRLKRFVKIGGEMVSLGGLEEDLTGICIEKGWVAKEAPKPYLCVVASGRESEKPLLYLFTTFAVNREEINQALKGLGHGRLVKIAEVTEIEEIPLTGTGKTHYRLLEEML
jgi:long-chain-fatty-acid--[acyl-carrier-protein] ligase